MFHSPFRVPNGDFDLPQHPLADLAHRVSQRRHRLGRVEIEDAHEILVAELVFRLHAAPGHEHVGDAHAGRLPERRAYVVLIIPLQERTVNDVEDVPLIFLPVLGRQAGGDGIKLLNEQGIVRSVFPFQQRGHFVHMAVFHRP